MQRVSDHRELTPNWYIYNTTPTLRLRNMVERGAERFRARRPEYQPIYLV